MRSFVFILAYKGPWWPCANISKICPLPEWLWTKQPGASYTCALPVCSSAIRISLLKLFMLLLTTEVQQGRTCCYLKWGPKWPTLTVRLQTGPTVSLRSDRECRSKGQESIDLMRLWSEESCPVGRQCGTARNQTSVCSPVEGKGKGMFINQEQLHSTHCVLEPNTPASESFTRM